MHDRLEEPDILRTFCVFIFQKQFAINSKTRRAYNIANKETEVVCYAKEKFRIHASGHLSLIHICFCAQTKIEVSDFEMQQKNIVLLCAAVIVLLIVCLVPFGSSDGAPQDGSAAAAVSYTHLSRLARRSIFRGN